ncbi:MAG TPA: TraB/GumN family protein [Geobacteraceae bacterium]|nr:TraB/GumN family protein [Geobacteraceae bacterium]
MKRVIVGLVMVMLAATWVSAASSVWKAQKEDAVIYLGGTFHMLREADYPLPPEFDRAYKASDVLIFETDIGKLQDPETQQKLLAKAMYTDGRTLDRQLSPRVYAELRAYCEANNIPLQALRQVKPSLLMVTLTMLELNRLGAVQQGVDQFFYGRAQKEGKAVEGLETVDEQLDYLVSMADGFEDDFVTYSLRDLKNSTQQFESLSAAWRSGNDGKLDELMAADLKTKQPKLYRKLVTERNRKWLPAIDRRQKPRRTKFFLVGVAHLVGPEGIIESLRKKGYKVDKL